MHILIAIIGIIASASYYFFVIRRAGDAAGEAIDLAQRARGKMRRKAFSKKVDGSVLTAVEDPGTAAAVLLIKVADIKSPITEESRATITQLITTEIGMSDAAEVVSFAEWVAGQVVEPKDILRKYRGVWMDHLTATELTGFADMVAQVAELDGDPAPEQIEVIRFLRERVSKPV